VGFLSDLFGSPRPQPKTLIKNVLGETLLEVPVRDLVGSTCLRGKDLSHAVLRGQWLDGADLRDTNFLGADLRGTSFYCCDLRNACLAYALISGARFDKADLDGADLLYTDVKRARFDGAIISNTSTIPGVYAGARREW
jgi:uncharacterized protein YjbI with pentapeptide repeats